MKRKHENGSLIWFRNDLRIHDNQAIYEALQHNSEIFGIYVFCREEMDRYGIAPVKVDFILRTLSELGQKIEIKVEIVDNIEEIGEILTKFCAENSIRTVFFNSTNTAGQFVEGPVLKKLYEAELSVRSFSHDQCIVEEGLILTKGEGKPYTMFTPFKRTWIEHLVKQPVKIFEVSLPGKYVPNIPQVVPGYDPKSQPGLDCEQVESLWPAGEEVALKRLEEFIASHKDDYDQTRNFPAQSGTSRLSPYLAIGAISPRFCLQQAQRANNGKLDSGKSGLVTWISELCWRDFYRHILTHFPHIAKPSVPFKSANIPWRAWPPNSDPHSEADFEKWCVGKTGYPIVDAAMRQLVSTGWMHNRLRMVVAMFLTKDLLIHWTRGERFFMERQIDGDFYSNNGGWQWSASTGTDSQPYFRIFNPQSQSEKFDPSGKFISKFVKELSQVKNFHCPTDSERSKSGYPKPIVDHNMARLKALEVFKKAFSK